MNRLSKPALSSLTVQSGLMTTLSGAISFGVLLFSDPSNYEKAGQCLTIFGQNETADNLLKISAVLPLFLGLSTVVGRVRAVRPVYTPKGFPGRDKEVLPPNG
jgi:hypothetical protein